MSLVFPRLQIIYRRNMFAAGIITELFSSFHLFGEHSRTNVAARIHGSTSRSNILYKHCV